MKYRLPRRVIGLLAAILVPLFCLFAVAHAANLLTNGGFNGRGPSDYVAQPGIIGVVPAGWTAVNLYGTPKYSSTWQQCNGTCYNEKTEGDNAVWIESQDIERNPAPGKPFTAVLYQSVGGVVSGTAYSFAASLLTACGGFAAGNPCAPLNYTITKLIGIDPTGRTDAAAPSVVWSPESGANGSWSDLSVAARALSNTVTVFLEIKWVYQFHGALGIIDAAYVSLSPTSTVGVSTPDSNGVMTVTWSGRMPQDVSDYWPGYQIGYDVQRLDTANNIWVDWYATTTQGRATYTGALNHTYLFRTRPVVYQPNDPDPPTRRLVGLYTDPVTATVGDTIPPVSSVAPLSSLQVTGTFAVAWSGVDNVTPANQLTYDIQLRDNNGAWTDWLTSTTSTGALYSGQAGHTYDFRSRAHDAKDNVEAYPGTPDATTAVDGTPPAAAVLALAATQRLAAFTVRWSGNDNATPANQLAYDIQARDNGGAWADWLTGTLSVSAQYTGEAGHTVDFRARARDLAGNSGAYPGTPDAATQVALATVSGTARNLREEAVAFARAALSPSGLADSLLPDGGYTVYVTTSGTYSLAVARSGYGVLPPLGGIVVTTANVTSIDAVLPPALDLIANGQFESGDLGGWTVSGDAAITTTAHSGAYALALGGTGAESSVQQTFYLSPTLGAPTLSYLYRAPDAAAPFTLTVSGDLTQTQIAGLAGPAWAQGWLDLSAYTGQTITVTLACLPDAAGVSLLIDEASAGDALVQTVYRVYLPVIAR